MGLAPTGKRRLCTAHAITERCRFEDDERDYGVASLMLRTLNCTRIVLLTNNPAKLDGLTEAGIEIAARVALEVPVTPHNKRYLTTKAARSGHHLRGDLHPDCRIERGD